jgi:excreted virulence factor EspC (type VII ESX diderm)
MADPVRIDPDVLREVATQHDAVADQISAARTAGEDIYAAVSTCGPIMHRVKVAVADVLAERDAALLEHGAAHRAVADELRRHAVAVSEVEAENVKRFNL